MPPREGMMNVQKFNYHPHMTHFAHMKTDSNRSPVTQLTSKSGISKKAHTRIQTTQHHLIRR